MWKYIDGYENYMVSDSGEVLSLYYNKTLKPEISKFGYARVSLNRNGDKPRRFSVHRLVAETFIGKCPDGMQVNHKDENKLNNCADNLEYVTPKENSNYGTRTERSIKKQKIQVYQCDEHFNIINVYPSMKDAEQAIRNTRNGGNICSACNGKGLGFNKHKMYGYYWYSERQRKKRK